MPIFIKCVLKLIQANKTMKLKGEPKKLAKLITDIFFLHFNW